MQIPYCIEISCSDTDLKFHHEPGSEPAWPNLKLENKSRNPKIHHK